MLVSVIIPCYNVEAYIAECLESVFLQTYIEIEVICVDNNSSDKTFDILQQFEAQGKIKLLKEEKAGASCTRNKGLSVAKGEWIQFLDADDLLLPEKIKHQLALINDNKEIAFVVGACFKQTVEGKRTATVLAETDRFKALFTTTLGNTCSNLFNTDKLRSIGGWNEVLKSSQESDLMFRLLKKEYAVIFDQQPLTVIRERVSGQISQGDPRKTWLQYVSLRIEIIDFLKKEKASYFEMEQNYYFQNLFSQLRTFAQYDLEAADVIFKKKYDKYFRPRSGSKFSIYALFFYLFGFKKAEQLKMIFSIYF